jgi:hypothetical protein
LARASVIKTPHHGVKHEDMFNFTATMTNLSMAA